jgi:hypothetical protein
MARPPSWTRLPETPSSSKPSSTTTRSSPWYVIPAFLGVRPPAGPLGVPCRACFQTRHCCHRDEDTEDNHQKSSAAIVTHLYRTWLRLVSVHNLIAHMSAVTVQAYTVALWGINLWAFSHSRVSYPKVFTIDPSNHLTHLDIWKVSASAILQDCHNSLCDGPWLMLKSSSLHTENTPFGGLCNTVGCVLTRSAAMIRQVLLGCQLLCLFCPP